VKLTEKFTVAGLLLRCLATLRQIAKAQDRIALASEQRVRIMAARAGVKPSKLADYLRDIEKEPEGETELLTQNDEELQRLYLQELEAAARGVGVDDLQVDEEEGPAR
jgi:hypothetical protein